MTDPLNGLRFDIYERVHLPDDVAAIDELEEIELVPHMQALAQDEQVLLKGHLLLSGVYRAQGTADGVSQLEHWIPVEITLPSNRVDKVEDLAVEIDNFDVDLLSTRSLNVTGVLALRGLQVSKPQTPVWRDDSFTVVHEAPAAGEVTDSAPEREDRFIPQAEREPEYEKAAAVEYIPDEEVDELELREANAPAENADESPAAEYSPPYYPSSAAKEAGVWPIAHQEEEPSPAPDPQQEYDLEQWIRAQQTTSESSFEPDRDFPDPVSYEVNRTAEPSGWGDLSSSLTEPEISVSDVYAPVQEEKPEMKVAVGTKSMETPSRPFAGVGLLSQLGDKGAAREAELQAMRSAQAETDTPPAADTQPSRTSTGDELEWTRLFLSKGAEAQSFRKLKMCIVQREDTLDAIAARYNVQTRELQLHNRLTDPYLSAGQVLYIP